MFWDVTGTGLSLESVLFLIMYLGGGVGVGLGSHQASGAPECEPKVINVS